MPSLDVLKRNPGLGAFLASRFAYVLGAGGAPVLLTLTTLDGGGSLTSLAFVLGAGAVPAIVGALISKWLSDRITTRGLLLSTTALWVVAAALTGVLLGFGVQSVAWLCVVSFVIELSAALQYPSLGSYLPQIVRKEDLERANSVKLFTTGAAGILGPALFSFTGGLLPVTAAWLVLAVVLLVSALPLQRLPRGQGFEADGAGVWGDLRDGWSYFWQSRGLWLVVVTSGVWHFVGWSVLTVAGPVLLRDGFDNLAAWGWLQSALAAGSLVGALVAGRLRPTRVATWALLSLCPPLVLGLLLALEAPIAVLVGLAAVTGAGLSVGGVVWASAVQREVPPERLGQVFGYDYLFSEAVNPLGLLLIPVLVGLAGNEQDLLRLTSLGLLVLVVPLAVMAPVRLTAARTAAGVGSGSAPS
ncbi:MFS transporter [Cellulomonas sp. KH9]|jgi:MFS family permease|uniref:MFS transporter n=1 Tax=Cellulomonas sp. KH9 TaxID=1855324 RepID=UPI0008EDD669|nr:MFS transporter [Cellulomonas sp. KH9]SFJ57908.1 Predicted arabinose efflux permease, MFS family [Cellulomonas sp. KH9]